MQNRVSLWYTPNWRQRSDAFQTIVFDRVRFFQTRQEEGEPVASFVDNVYALAKYCNFGALNDELIEDILVVDIRDKKYWNNYR